MKIADIKKKMLVWRDFYGADIFESETPKVADFTNKKGVTK